MHYDLLPSGEGLHITRILPFLSQGGVAQLAVELPTTMQEELKPLLASGDFTAKAQQTSLFYSREGGRWLLLGLGDPLKIHTESLRRSYAQACSTLHSLRTEEVLLYIPQIPKISFGETLKGSVEGLELANYAFTRYKPLDGTLLKKVYIEGSSNESLREAQRIATVVEGVNLARDLVNMNADEVTPQHLAEKALDFTKKHAGVRCEVYTKERLIQESMGLILAVGSGARHPPVLIQLQWQGDPQNKDHTVILGKGVTFDTGGLNLKPTGSMETMKEDMSGAAACLGLLHVIASLQIKKNVTFVIPSVENAIDSHAYKPGDVIRAYNGKTVEVNNTDAEGRLILGDALSYTVAQLAPSRMIDLATLTGGAIIALGHEATALMGNSKELAEQLIASGERTGERLWELPLWDDYRPAMLSDIADLKNAGSGRAASSIRGGIFLKEFVGEVPWVHLDIAGTAYLTDTKRYGVKHATGVGVRLLADWLSK